jgi:hypothetical protein
MEPEGSLSFSQKLATGICREPNESGLNFHKIIIFLEDPF